MPGGLSKPAAREVIKKFRMIFGAAKHHFRLVEEMCGLGGAQLWALSEIARSPGIGLGPLADAMLIHQSTASNLIERISKMGLITKRKTASDRRAVCLYVTAKGRKILADAPHPTIGVLPDALQRMPQTALDELSQSLALLVDMMRVRDAGAAEQPLASL